MIIQIDGTNTLNKGAELMLYSVLNQLDLKGSKTRVIYNPSNRDIDQIKYNAKHISIKKRWVQEKGRYCEAILRRLGFDYSYFTSKHPSKGIDILLDAGGFQFSDQWNYSEERLNLFEKYYSKLKSYGTKIIFLPQALGPFQTESGKRTVEILSKYADIVIAREKVSYNYMLDSGFPQNKLWLYPDFTLKIDRLSNSSITSIPEKSICFIPNKKMLTHTSSKKETYLNLFKTLINLAKEKGYNPILLNHEGKGDYELCKIIKNQIKFDIALYTNLNAFEVKSIIGQSYLTISSRFHGVASSLNQVVPCLATSWNHKYEQLFNDFGITGNIIKVEENFLQENVSKFLNLLDHDYYQQQQEIMKKNKLIVEKRIDEMWSKIWSLIKA